MCNETRYHSIVEQQVEPDHHYQQHVRGIYSGQELIENTPRLPARKSFPCFIGKVREAEKKFFLRGGGSTGLTIKKKKNFFELFFYFVNIHLKFFNSLL